MDRAGDYSTRIVATPSELDALAVDWARCWIAQPRPEVSQHLEALRRDHPAAAGQSAVWAVVVERCGEVIGIAPLVTSSDTVTWKVRLLRTNRPVFRFPVTAVEVVGEHLMAPDDPAARQALLAGVLDACRPVDVIRFRNSRIDLNGTLSSSSARQERRWLWIIERESPALIVRLAEDFPTYLHQSLTKKRRDNVRRERRILADLDKTQLRLQVVTESVDVRGFLDHADRVFANSWHAHRGARGISNNERTRDRFAFLAERGWLRCYLLMKGDEPIAYVYGLQSGRTFRAVRAGYSTPWARYSPGKSLWFSIVEDLHDSGTFDELHFGYGDWEYKRIMANDEYLVSSSEAIRPGIRNALVWSGPIAYRALRSTTLMGLKRLQLDGRVVRWARKNLAR